MSWLADLVLFKTSRTIPSATATSRTAAPTAIPAILPAPRFCGTLGGGVWEGEVDVVVGGSGAPDDAVVVVVAAAAAEVVVTVDVDDVVVLGTVDVVVGTNVFVCFVSLFVLFRKNENEEG